MWLLEDYSWISGGVDPRLAGVGGQDCYEYSTPLQRLYESMFFLTVASVYILIAKTKLSLPERFPNHLLSRDSAIKGALVTITALVFGIEIGFKFASSQIVWILNPCHVATIIQLILLILPPSRYSTALFRLHLYWLAGGIVAVAFPVLNTRMFPGEKEVYFLQHLLLLVAPLYLCSNSMYYEPERVTDMSWALVSMAMLISYHFILLQPLGVVTLVNLNNMLCPAVSDPFRGPWYRWFTIAHQTLIVLLQGKAYCWIGAKLVTRAKQAECERLKSSNPAMDNGILLCNSKCSPDKNS